MARSDGFHHRRERQGLIVSNIEEVKPPPLDASEAEKKELKNYIANGLPGISAANEKVVKQALEMYMSGATYSEISNRLMLKRNLIVYLSYKFDWYQAKIELLSSLVGNIKQKAEVAHVQGINLITDMMAALEHYYRSIINNYSISKDTKILESVDMENFKIYVKCLEQIEAINNPESKKKAPTLGLSLPNGGTVTKLSDNSIEVSAPSQEVSNQLGQVLSALASLKRAKEEVKK